MLASVYFLWQVVYNFVPLNLTPKHVRTTKKCFYFYPCLRIVSLLTYNMQSEILYYKREGFDQNFPLSSANFEFQRNLAARIVYEETGFELVKTVNCGFQQL